MAPRRLSMHTMDLPWCEIKMRERGEHYFIPGRQEIPHLDELQVSLK